MQTDQFKKMLLTAFTTEASELLEQISRALQQDWSSTTSQLLFRHFHSLKGTAALLEFENLTQAAHLAETLARSGFEWTRPELQYIFEYITQSIKQIINNQTELTTYSSANADKLINRISMQESSIEKEKQVLFQLFTKHLLNLEGKKSSMQSGNIKTLIRAADLMEINDLSVELNRLALSSNDYTDEQLQQHLLEQLITHESFGNDFLNFYQKAKQ